jgi:ubiquitin conjugation factor E4 A
VIFFSKGEYLGQIFELILMFMGSRTWVKNPHLRAKLAECLEALLPKADQQGMVANSSVFNREQLFLGHPHRLDDLRYLKVPKLILL